MGKTTILVLPSSSADMMPTVTAVLFSDNMLLIEFTRTYDRGGGWRRDARPVCPLTCYSVLLKLRPHTYLESSLPYNVLFFQLRRLACSDTRRCCGAACKTLGGPVPEQQQAVVPLLEQSWEWHPVERERRPAAATFVVATLVEPAGRAGAGG